MAKQTLGSVEDDQGSVLPMPVERGVWRFDEDDFLLFALLTDGVYCPELLWDDAGNHEYGGCYRVRDYQYRLFRPELGESPYTGFACGRSLGKTEGIKSQAFCHAFRRLGQDMLISAPELIHLLPLTDSIEDKMRDVRLTRDFLDVRGGQTGFQHRPFQANFMDGTKIVGRIPRQTGPQPRDARIVTPTGWTTMGEVAVGDYVVGSDGRPTRVLEVHEKGERQVYALRFSDGSVVEACAEHRFKVRRDRCQPWREMTVREIAACTEKPAAGRQKYWLHVPDAEPVHYAPLAEPLPMDPWLLGVLLGDGGLSTHAIYLTNPDEEVVRGVEAALPQGCSLKRLERDYRYLIVGEGRGKANRLNRILREIGLLGEPHAGSGSTAKTKRIPEAFMRASLRERLALLQGLMDTDGTASKTGKVEITLANRALIDQIAELSRSLGGWASVRPHVLKPYTQVIDGKPYENKGGTFWRATLDMGALEPFRLSRKLARCRPRTSPRTRAIKVVEPTRVTDTRCISVAANDHLYLTDFFIPVFNTGVKGSHAPDVIIDEAQDYPERGWTEIHEVVMKDTVDSDGNPDFRYYFYGVQSGARDSGFFKRVNAGAFEIVTATAMMRPGWSKAEKDAAKAAYGGTGSSDYRRNILGEPGSAASALFVTSRLVACLDQDRESDYNQHQYRHIEYRAEEVEEIGLPVGEIIDLPDGLKNVWAGMDLGLTNSPTVLMLFNLEKVGNKTRLKLYRRIHLARFRTRHIREVLYAMAYKYGAHLRGFGLDVTGLGFPIWQEMEDDESAPKRLLEVSRGYFFNAKVPVGVDQAFVTEDDQGNLRDQFGATVKREHDALSDSVRYVTYMPMIEASTRYLREMVDGQFLLLPFDTEITSDMQGETQQRVKAMGGVKKKPNAFHVLDAMRAMAMAFRAGDVEEQLQQRGTEAVLDASVEIGGDFAYG